MSAGAIGDRSETELVPQRAERPLLRERRAPVAVARARVREDVLHDSRLLVVRLFDQETVVLNRSVVLAGKGGARDEQNGKDAKRLHRSSPHATCANFGRTT